MTSCTEHRNSLLSEVASIYQPEVMTQALSK